MGSIDPGTGIYYPSPDELPEPPATVYTPPSPGPSEADVAINDILNPNQPPSSIGSGGGSSSSGSVITIAPPTEEQAKEILEQMRSGNTNLVGVAAAQGRLSGSGIAVYEGKVYDVTNPASPKQISLTPVINPYVSVPSSPQTIEAGSIISESKSTSNINGNYVGAIEKSSEEDAYFVKTYDGKTLKFNTKEEAVAWAKSENGYLIDKGTEKEDKTSFWMRPIISEKAAAGNNFLAFLRGKPAQGGTVSPLSLSPKGVLEAGETQLIFMGLPEMKLAQGVETIGGKAVDVASNIFGKGYSGAAAAEAWDPSTNEDWTTKLAASSMVLGAFAPEISTIAGKILPKSDFLGTTPKTVEAKAGQAQVDDLISSAKEVKEAKANLETIKEQVYKTKEKEALNKEYPTISEAGSTNVPEALNPRAGEVKAAERAYEKATTNFSEKLQGTSSIDTKTLGKVEKISGIEGLKNTIVSINKQESLVSNLQTGQIKASKLNVNPKSTPSGRDIFATTPVRNTNKFSALTGKPEPVVEVKSHSSVKSNPKTGATESDINSQLSLFGKIEEVGGPNSIVVKSKAVKGGRLELEQKKLNDLYSKLNDKLTPDSLKTTTTRTRTYQPEIVKTGKAIEQPVGLKEGFDNFMSDRPRTKQIRPTDSVQQQLEPITNLSESVDISSSLAGKQFQFTEPKYVVEPVRKQMWTPRTNVLENAQYYTKPITIEKTFKDVTTADLIPDNSISAVAKGIPREGPAVNENWGMNFKDIPQQFDIGETSTFFSPRLSNYPTNLNRFNTDTQLSQNIDGWMPKTKIDKLAVALGGAVIMPTSPHTGYYNRDTSNPITSGAKGQGFGIAGTDLLGGGYSPFRYKEPVVTKPPETLPETGTRTESPVRSVTPEQRAYETYGVQDMPDYTTTKGRTLKENPLSNETSTSRKRSIVDKDLLKRENVNPVVGIPSINNNYYNPFKEDFLTLPNTYGGTDNQISQSTITETVPETIKKTDTATIATTTTKTQIPVAIWTPEIIKGTMYKVIDSNNPPPPPPPPDNKKTTSKFKGNPPRKAKIPIIPLLPKGHLSGTDSSKGSPSGHSRKATYFKKFGSMPNLVVYMPKWDLDSGGQQMNTLMAREQTIVTPKRKITTGMTENTYLGRRILNHDTGSVL